MTIYISGLDTQDGITVQSPVGAGGPASLLSVDDFFKAAESAGDSFSPSARWVWLYRAPWALLDAGPDACLSWLPRQQMLLKLRRLIGKQLTLVNLDRVSPAMLNTHLDLPDSTIQFAVPTRGAPQQELDAALAKMFEWAAPRYWDVFEALEAAVWLPQGEALFRSNLPIPSDALLSTLGQVLQDATLLQDARTRILANEERMASLQAENMALVEACSAHEQSAKEQQVLIDGLVSERAALTSDIKKLEAAEQEARHQSQTAYKTLEQENELLLQQLHQVQEELETYFLMNQEQQVRADGLNAEKAELAKDIEKLKSAEQEAKARSQATQKSLEEENELLLQQLHHVQEELESYYLANQELLFAMGQSQATMNRARAVISRFVLSD